METPLFVAAGAFNPDRLLLPVILLFLAGFGLCAWLRISDWLTARQRRRARGEGANIPFIG